MGFGLLEYLLVLKKGRRWWDCKVKFLSCHCLPYSTVIPESKNGTHFLSNVHIYIIIERETEKTETEKESRHFYREQHLMALCLFLTLQS